jgi:hypothetical protein
MVTTADQNLVRKFNTAVVLNTIRHHAPLSRAEVAKFHRFESIHSIADHKRAAGTQAGAGNHSSI